MIPIDKGYLVKLVFIGNGATGKTSLIERFTKNTFQTSYLMTIGANFYMETVQIENKKVKLQIWDLAGQEHFKSVRPGFYIGVMLCIAVFDLTRESTIKDLDNWMDEMYNSAKVSLIPTVLIGNKVDLEELRAINYEYAHNYTKLLAKRYPVYQNLEIPYYETSAKTGKNVKEAFIGATKLFLESLKPDIIKDL